MFGTCQEEAVLSGAWGARCPWELANSRQSICAVAMPASNTHVNTSAVDEVHAYLDGEVVFVVLNTSHWDVAICRRAETTQSHPPGASRVVGTFNDTSWLGLSSSPAVGS